MTINNEIITVAGQRWKIREAFSMKYALDCINYCRARGSIGAKDIVTHCTVETVLADVVKVNSDDSECTPYQDGY